MLGRFLCRLGLHAWGAWISLRGFIVAHGEVVRRPTHCYCTPVYLRVCRRDGCKRVDGRGTRPDLSSYAWAEGMPAPAYPEKNR